MAKGKKKKAEGTGNEKIDKIINKIADLSVLELSELVEAVEEKFGVEAIAAAPAAAAPAGGGEQAEEKSEYTVVLADVGDKKINVIKALRKVKPDLGLKDAKDLTEKTPADILVDVKKEQAEEAKKGLEEAGATVELK